jgi:hypothetical protein
LHYTFSFVVDKDLTSIDQNFVRVLKQVTKLVPFNTECYYYYPPCSFKTLLIVKCYKGVTFRVSGDYKKLVLRLSIKLNVVPISRINLKCTILPYLSNVFCNVSSLVRGFSRLTNNVIYASPVIFLSFFGSSVDNIND